MLEKTLNEISNKICVPNKTEDLNLRLCNMITGMNEPKTLEKHVSYKCEWKFDSRKCNSNQKWNNDKCQCECKNKKNHQTFEKIYIWNPGPFSYKNGKYLWSVIDYVWQDYKRWR